MTELKELTCAEDCSKPYSDNVEIITVILVSGSLILMLFCIEWSFRNREKLSHYFEYSVVFTTGAIINTSILFTWPLNDSQSTCNIKPILIAIGSGLMFGIFVARIRKIWFNFVWLRRQSLADMRRIINSKKMDREPKIILGSIISLELFLLGIFFIVPKFRPICICQNYLEEDMNYSTCSFDSTFGFLALCLNFFPIALSAFYGYEILKEFQKTNDIREHHYAFRNSTKSNASFSTFNSTETLKRRSSFKKFFKSSSESAKSKYENLAIGEILGVRQDEVDEFKPIFIVVSFVLFISLLLSLVAVLTNALERDHVKRIGYYLSRCLIIMSLTCIPVIIIYSRAYSLVTFKKYKIRDEEEEKTKEKKHVSDRIVRAFASFRGTMPGDSPSPWRSQSTGFTSQTESTNSFQSDFKTNVREKLLTNNDKETVDLTKT